ncbi:hypothetical protein UQ29_24325 [Escherichia coli]|nr:hypothetical protein UQ29_24325 [Escherichia coli]
MTFKHYDVVRAASPSDLAEKLTHKLKEGWQPFGSPVAITPYTPVSYPHLTAPTPRMDHGGGLHTRKKKRAANIVS